MQLTFSKITSRVHNKSKLLTNIIVVYELK